MHAKKEIKQKNVSNREDHLHNWSFLRSPFEDLGKLGFGFDQGTGTDMDM
jgi:hypothetical protein